MKRLRIQGSTLRSQSTDYKAEVIRRYENHFLTASDGSSIHAMFRFGELLRFFTGSKGNGPIRTYIHKASYVLSHLQKRTLR